MNKILYVLWFCALAAMGFVLVSLAGCGVALTPEVIAALAKDNASFCARADTRGGMGSLLNPAGGYGQATLEFCRSNAPSARMVLLPDGSISIEHGRAN